MCIRDRIRRARVAISQQKPRYLKCPYCQHNATAVYEDTRGKGMVQDIRRIEIGCILFGSDTRISEGTKVTRTGKRAGVPVGDAYIGRVVNALVEPIDGKGSIEADGYRP